MGLIRNDVSKEFPIIQLEGDFVTNDDIDELRSSLKKFSQQEKSLVAIDLEKTNFLSSAALGVLLSANALFEKNMGKFVIAKPNNYIRNLFKITKIETILDITPTIFDAFEILKKFKNSPQQQ
ncbi:MAG: STAS domain-containing protein [Candidatus Kapaibacteriales bacterium]